MILILVPVITSIVEILKNAGLPAKYSQVASLLLGVLGGLAMSFNLTGAGYGLIAGLSATGLYEGYKTTKKTLTK